MLKTSLQFHTGFSFSIDSFLLFRPSTQSRSSELCADKSLLLKNFLYLHTMWPCEHYCYTVTCHCHTVVSWTPQQIPAMPLLAVETFHLTNQDKHWYHCIQVEHLDQLKFGQKHLGVQSNFHLYISFFQDLWSKDIISLLEYESNALWRSMKWVLSTASGNMHATLKSLAVYPVVWSTDTDTQRSHSRWYSTHNSGHGTWY